MPTKCRCFIEGLLPGEPCGAGGGGVRWQMTLCRVYPKIKSPFPSSFLPCKYIQIRDSRLIAKNYMKFWFPIDLIATIPYDLFAMALGVSSDGNSTQTIILQFTKTPRLLRLGRCARGTRGGLKRREEGGGGGVGKTRLAPLAMLILLPSFCYCRCPHYRLIRLMEHVKNINGFKVFLLILLMIAFSHWLACIW